MNNDMRVAVTKRMLREGMLRCLEANPLSKITVSDLCRESGINRATFYNHYETPAMILKEIVYEYAEQLSAIYESRNRHRGKDDAAAVEECLTFIAGRKEELKLLFSDNAEQFLSGVVMEIINQKLAKNAPSAKTKEQRDEYLLMAATSSAAAFGFVQIWLTMDIDRTPKELVAILKKVVQGNVFM